MLKQKDCLENDFLWGKEKVDSHLQPISANAYSRACARTLSGGASALSDPRSVLPYKPRLGASHTSPVFRVYTSVIATSDM
eukprot:910950-Pleurochrysis_carterae.AAC.5